jgi:hypothetical protein
MLSDERPIEREQVDQEEVWSAIRYLDPDEQDKDREAKSATIIAVLALLLTVCAVWVVLWLRMRGLSIPATQILRQGLLLLFVQVERPKRPLI